MSELYRFLDVRHAASGRTYTFTLRSGEIRLLQLADKTEKEAIMDWAVGETVCAEGSIQITVGERRSGKADVTERQEERRGRNDPLPVLWNSVRESRRGRVGWVAGNGGLISNLKVWENITLPLWYHTKREVDETERSIEYWLALLGMEPSAFADFMAALPYSLEPWQLRLAGMLRALVQMPRVLIVDAGVFEEIKAHWLERWIFALETYAGQGRAVLVLADKATELPWEKIV